MTALMYLVGGFIFLFVFLTLLEERKRRSAFLALFLTAYCFTTYLMYVI